MAQEPVRILIETEDGRVVGVYTAGVPVEFVLVDYDTGGGSKPNVRKVDGVPACVTGGAAFPDGPAVLKAFEAWEA